MNLFQIVTMVVVACLFVGSLSATLRGRVARSAGAAWMGAWLAALVAIAWPEGTAKFAHALGIGRGADLVFYCAALVMILGFWMIYVRLRRIRREMTLLVRQLALRDALTGKSGARAPETDTSASKQPDAP